MVAATRRLLKIGDGGHGGPDGRHRGGGVDSGGTRSGVSGIACSSGVAQNGRNGLARRGRGGSNARYRRRMLSGHGDVEVNRCASAMAYIDHAKDGECTLGGRGDA